ncbi:MAG: riboflavin synthase [Dehalococcoidia bacterium]|nr:riboflavin synthase [Dehalococcoidia bacterium]
MFTGIVEEVGQLKFAGPGKLVIAARKVLEGTRLGDSIAVNGPCLTVTAIGNADFSVDVMPETLRRTTLGTLKPGDKINLERALALGDRFGGHFVQGHIDGTGKIVSFVPEGDAVIMKVSAPPQITRYAVEKGFVAIDGISLTIVECDAHSVSVSLVTYTQNNTTFADKRPGGLVNLEIDIIAKYVEKLAGKYKPEMTLEFLAQHGFA